MAGKITEMTELSVPSLEDLMEVVDDPSGTPLTRKLVLNRLGGLFSAQICQGRLTTESGVPVSTSDRTSQGTLYWTPCTPDGMATALGLVGFYDGTRYVIAALSQLSLDLSTAEAGGAIDDTENYDVFIDYAAGTPALVLGPSWTNDTTRATALAQQGSIIVLTGDTDWRWVGTIRASGSGVTEDSGGGTTTQVGGKRFVWNTFNQVPRPLCVVDLTDSWTYGSATVRQSNGAAGNKVEVVTGAATSLIALSARQMMSAGAGPAAVLSGIGEDSTTTFMSGVVMIAAASSSNFGAGGHDVSKIVPLGYHAYNWVEQVPSGSLTITFRGDDGLTYGRHGLNGWIRA